MGVAALILGILGLIIAWIPLCGMVALLPCVIGLCLGIADIVVKSKREQPRGVSIAGTILNAIALAILIIWNVYIAAQIANDPEFSTAFQQAMEEAAKKNGTITVEAENVEVVETPIQE